MCLRFLPTSEIKNPTTSDKGRYAAPLPHDVIFTKADCSTTYIAVKELQEEFGINTPQLLDASSGS